MSVTKEELDRYTQYYNQGHALISDEKFDELLEEYLKEHGGETSRPYTRDVQTYGVNVLVGTLSKVYGVTKPMRDGMKTYEQWVNKKIPDSSYKIILQPKWDGASVAFDFNEKKFFTRGDYDNGQSVDITSVFGEFYTEQLLNWRNKYYPDMIAVKFEAILSKENFFKLKFNESYDRPRDVVASTITSRNKERAQYISLIPLRALTYKHEQFIPNELLDVSMNFHSNDYANIQLFIDKILDNGATVKYDNMTYECDGVVVSVVNDLNFINSDKEVAIKILHDVKETKLRDIQWQFGKTGKITPVAIFDPTEFDNGRVTVDHATLSTFDRVVSMGLRYNDTIRVMYNIVPYFMDSRKDGDIPVPIPKQCPRCGHPFDLHVLSQVRCLNRNCPGIKIGGIVRYCEKMKMLGLSDGIINKLVDNKVISDIPSLYDLSPDDIKHLSTFGETSANNIVNTIKTNSSNVEFHKWLGALPILDTSDKTWKVICDTLSKYNISLLSVMSQCISSPDGCMKFIDVITTQMGSYPNIGSAKLSRIIEGVQVEWDTICRTFKHITFKTSSNKQYKGTVTLTGTRNKNLIQTLEEHDWNVVDFNSKIDYLIIPERGYTSSKTEKATKYGITIIPVEEAFNFMKNGDM